MRTAPRTIRFTHPVIDRLDREAKAKNCTSSDIVRLAIAQYFDAQQTESALRALEARLIERIDAHGNHLHAAIGQILELAEPSDAE